MRKLTKASLSELAESKEIISFREQKSYVGGGNGTLLDPYSNEEYFQCYRMTDPNGYYWGSTGGIYKHGELVQINGTYDYAGNTNYTGITNYAGNTNYIGGTNYAGNTNYTGGTNYDGNNYYSGNNEYSYNDNGGNSGSGRIPTYDLLSKAFASVAHEKSSVVYEKIGGKVLLNHQNQPNMFRDACALRISVALNSIGYTISYQKDKTLSGDINNDNKKEWYYYRAADVKDFIERKFGHFSKINSLKDIKGRKGFIYYGACEWRNGAGEHIDLYDGTTVESHDYSNKCNEIYFVEIK